MACDRFWLADIANLKYATVPPMHILREIAHILQHYYPERLYRAYVLFAPWVFKMIWKMVQSLLTENTKRKIVVPGYEESRKYETFAEEVEKDKLDERFGGELEVQYSYEWEVQQHEQRKGIEKEQDQSQEKEKEQGQEQVQEQDEKEDEDVSEVK